MAKLRSTDDMMREYLISTRQETLDAQRDARIEAADPGYLDQESTREGDPYAEAGRQFNDVLLTDKGRELDEVLQDTGAGLMGSFGAIGGTADLALQAIADSIANAATVGRPATWDRTAGALERLESTGEYWNSLQSEKSNAFDRINAYRQQQAVEQNNLESQAQTGEDASWGSNLATEAGAAIESYLENPGQILTEGVAQLPYLLGGVVAKGVTTGTKLANPLMARLVARGMTKESAEKLVQMGIVGGLTAPVEGADAASSAYSRVMASTDTFGPGQEAERESAALEAAGKAFLIAGSTAGITGALASKFDLSPVSTAGGSALARSGDNLIKALQEGVQEAIESGTSQFAGNYGGNTVLKGKDLVELDQGVGGAAGTGLVVGAGSTLVTNPRSALDAAVAPLALAGKGLGALGNQASRKEYQADQAANQEVADKIVADSGDETVTAALNQPILDSTGAELTTQTPPENVVLPPEVVTNKTPFHTFASGFEYLKGKDMNSKDVVTAFHVLGQVLAAAPIAGRVRDNLKEVIENPETSPETRAAAQEKLTLIDSMVDPEKLDAWIEGMNTDRIDAVLGQLEENPEQFASVVAQLAARSPMKVSAKMLNSSALESQSLPSDQRNSIELAKELQEAEAELNVKPGPTSSEVSRSIMQTGFPGASSTKQSIADMLRNVTNSLAQNDPKNAQSYFNKLTAFSQYLTARAGRFDQALDDMNASGAQFIDVPDTRTWVNQELTDIPFRLVAGNANSLGIRVAAMKDAEVVAKMVEAMQKRTGLNIVTAPVKPTKEAPKKPQETSKAKTQEKTAKATPAKAAAAPESQKEDSLPWDENDKTNVVQDIPKKETIEPTVDTSVPVAEAAPKAKTESESKPREVFPTSASGFTPLNREQAEGIKKIQAFLADPKAGRVFVLDGKAGTGKTTIMQEALYGVLSKGKTVHISAVSHKAKTVLESKLNSYIRKAKLRGEVVAKALAGLLGMEMKFDPKKQKTGFVLTQKSRDTAPILDASVVVVDEASMLDQDTIDDILSMAPPGAKIIFLGDIGQLAPIEGRGEISPIFTNKDWPKHNLVERVRQGEDSAILPYADYYWNNSQSDDAQTIPVPADERVNKDGLTFLRTTGEMLAQYGKTFAQAVKDKNPNLIKVVAFNNKEGNTENAEKLRKLENQIRQLAHGKDGLAEWEVGELVIMNNMFKVNDDTIIENSREFAVTAVSAGSTISFEIDGQMVEFPGNRVTVRDHDTGEVFTMPVLSKANNMAASKNLKSKVQAWGNKISSMEPGKNKSAEWKKFYAVQQGAAELTYGYVITSHKAQGSTYGTSIVLEDNFNNMAKFDELNVSRGIYTAITRASKEVVILSRLNPANQTAVVKQPVAETKKSEPVVDDISKEQSEEIDAEQEEVFQASSPTGEKRAPSGKKGRNHFSGKLMPDYSVQENATLAQKEKAKNQLANSFTSAENKGLSAEDVAEVLNSPAALAERLGANEQLLTKVFGLTNTIIQRMNGRLSGSLQKWELKQLVNGKNPIWNASKFLSLHAAIWDENGIKFQNQIGQIMAWTGIQHMLDIVVPMRWSDDKKHSFVETFGNDIVPMLEDGWVPLSDQIQQTADKLRRNLGLVADKTVTQSYTEGVLLSLAADALASMFVHRDANGEVVRNGPIEIRRMSSIKKNAQGTYSQTNWIKVFAENRDLLFDAAAALEPLFPERSNAAAALVGKPSQTVRKTYRGTDQKISEEQEKGLEEMGKTEHRISPLMGNAWKALSKEAILYIFGARALPKDEKGNEVAYTIAEIAQRGLNQTVRSDYTVMKNHMDRIKAYAEANNMDPEDVPSFFEYEVTTNGRSMTKGTSPQSSKAYREIISNVRETIDTTEENRGFMMAVAQGLGIKMDSQPIEESLKELLRYLDEPSVQRALEAGARLAAGFNYGDNTKLLNADVNSLVKMTVKGDAIELTPHAFTALVHMAKYKEAAKNKESFVSSLAYEIDGKTDGPINLMMMMGLRNGAKAMEKLYGLGGLFFGENPISIQDMTDQLKLWHRDSKDLYEIISKDAGEANVKIGNKMVDAAKENDKEDVRRMLHAIGNVMKAAGLVKKFGGREITHSRSFSKKATQAVGYLQGAQSIVNDLGNTLIEALSVLQHNDKLWTADLQKDINFILSNKIEYNEIYGKSKITSRQNNIGVSGWDGRLLTRAEFQGLTENLKQFGGYGLVTATMKAVGYQRNRMMQAVQLVNAHVIFAQKKLTELYAAKQKELVQQGLLSPGQALSSKDEKAVIQEVMDKYVPHPKIRTTSGLPVASLARTQVAESLVSRLQMGAIPDQYQGVSSAAFEDMGVSFAALSIMAGGDAAMVVGFYNNHSFNALNMYDGIYIKTADINKVGNALNKEVRKNWNHSFISSILESLPETSDEMYEAVLEWNKKQPEWLHIDYDSSLKILKYQEDVQKQVLQETNETSNSISHMAGHEDSDWQEGKPLNSTTLGTSITDPLLDLAAENLGSVANGIRKMSVADVKALMKDHTFENPVLGGLWRVLSPLLNGDTILYMSSDKQAMADFYQQNERREMGQKVDGVSVGNAVYVRAINAETMVHELLHATTKNLTATYFASPGSLTKQQQEAMKNLLALKAQFMEMDGANLPPHQRAMVEHVQAIMKGLDENSSLQEFLAYGLTNYHLQRTLSSTKSTLGKLLESVFNAVKALFGFPNGTQSDSMLAQMFSNFEALTEQAVDQVYPISVDEALNSINPDLARKFGEVLRTLEQKATSDASKIQAQTARADGLIRMQEIAKTNLFPSLTALQVAAGSYVQAMFSVGVQIKSEDNALLASVVDEVRAAGAKLWRSNDNPNDQADIALAEARYSFFFDPILKPGAQLTKDRKDYLLTKHDLAADLLAMTLVNPDFAERMNKEVLGRKKIDKSKLDNWLDSVAEKVYELMNTGLSLKKDATLADALELAATRMRKSMLASATQRQQQPNAYRRLTDKLNEGVQHIGEKAGKAADARLGLTKNKEWVGSGLMIAAALGNDSYADNLGRLTLSLTNQMKNVPGRELVQEMVGTVTNNFKLIQLKGVATRMVSAVRQSFREQIPVTVKSWFTELTPEQDELLHLVIGKMGLYEVSEDIRDQMEQVLADPTNAIKDAEATLLAGGNLTKRKLMVKYAKDLGNYMASKSTMAVYRNTEAVRTLVMDGGGERLSDKELEALENLSTLQALSHLTQKQRQDTLTLLRENKEGFWKTAVLIHSFKNFDTRRAGKMTATLNFQKGWIPTESDHRKALRLVKVSEVRQAERLGWVQVGKFSDDPSMVYMATTVAKTPTLSGGAIHAVDKHMNGIHFHSGMPIDPGIQTTITNPKAVSEIKNRILNGEVLPYTVLYDASNEMVGFQRLLDPAMLDRHTKTVGRISDAAGIWMGRLHEESIASGQNQAAVNLLGDTWDQAINDKEQNEFVDITTGRAWVDGLPGGPVDKVIANVWKTLPYHTKYQLESKFSDGSRNPPVWIRKDQLNDAIGYHKASAGNFFTRDNRYADQTNEHVAALARQMIGKNAYKYVILGEEGWQAVIGSAKDTIIVKSLFIALNNLASNQTQLMMITGNPIWNVRVQSQKHKELVSYLSYQQRLAQLHGEELATNDLRARARIDAEQKQLHVQIRRLSIWPLIEAGELPTIAEGLSETEEFSMMGDLTAWLEKQMGKLPPVVSTVAANLAVSKETSLYKGMDRMVQYGDFVAKATMYEWMTTQDKAAKKEAIKLMVNDKNPDKKKRVNIAQALHIVALKEVNDEFVNYSRLPGRWRTYGEDMGMLWFFNYKLRIMKMTARRMRKNPAAFVIGSQVGGLLGIQTLLDTLPWNMNLAYSTGLDPLYTAHQTIVWNQIFN